MPPIDDERPETSQQHGPGTRPPAPAKPAVQQRAVAALLLALLSLAGLLSVSEPSRGIYIVLYALLAGALAMWLAVTAMNRSRREYTARPRAGVTAAVIAAIGMMTSALILVAFAVLGQQLQTYGNCLRAANTISAQQACQRQFTSAVNRKITALQKGRNG